MANKENAVDTGQNIVIRQKRSANFENAGKKFTVGCMNLFAFAFFGLGAIVLLPQVASGKTEVDFKGIPLGVLGGIIFLLILFGWLFYAIFKNFSVMRDEPRRGKSVKQKDCIISMKGVTVHDANDFNYVLKWEGIQSIALIQDSDGQKYVGLKLKDQRYLAACLYTNELINSKRTRHFALIFPESSLPSSAVTFIDLLVQRAKLEGTLLIAETTQEKLREYVSASENNVKLNEAYENASFAVSSLFWTFVFFAALALLFYIVVGP